MPKIDLRESLYSLFRVDCFMPKIGYMCTDPEYSALWILSPLWLYGLDSDINILLFVCKVINPAPEP